MKHESKVNRQAAVALHYNGKGAPVVTAKGNGAVAERILEIAREHGIPIDEDPALITLLSEVPLGNEIPQALYAAVAEVLAYVYDLSGKSVLHQKE